MATRCDQQWVGCARMTIAQRKWYHKPPPEATRVERLEFAGRKHGSGRRITGSTSQGVCRPRFTSEEPTARKASAWFPSLASGPAELYFRAGFKVQACSLASDISFGA